jgi:transcription initiation factor TFIIH subunit 1
VELANLSTVYRTGSRRYVAPTVNILGDKFLRRIKMAMPADGTAYTKVIHKQLEGTLFLNKERINFRPNKEEAINVSLFTVVKHQVSPATYPRSLLKLNIDNESSLTFQFQNRPELERIRKDLSKRLQVIKSQTNGPPKNALITSGSSNLADFGSMDPTAAAVTRSSLLASNPTLRDQYYYLVTETATVSEEDFWNTHRSLVENEYAKISGQCKTGPSSVIQSHLVTTQRGNTITLGVEEMRQIFILYPAVHKAYEEKVPLELSDEQFWRKYLESEFFHRDRGRLGTAARNHATNSKGEIETEKKSSSGTKLSLEQQDARAAAVGTDDLFARYDQKIREAAGASNSVSETGKRKWGTNLAAGQFDLASTFETERGRLLEGPRDNHPPNPDEEKNAQVIQKYNRHWAMVLHPDDAVAGSDLAQVARKSVTQVLRDDDDFKAHGGLIEETMRLVNFANADELDANHVTCTALEDEPYQWLSLSNIEAYSIHKEVKTQSSETKEDAEKRRKVFAHQMVQKIQLFADSARDRAIPDDQGFPDTKLGRNLLTHLTKRMAEDAKTDEDCHDAVNRLDEDFRKKLDTYFRRSSELLRHFFGLRRMNGPRTQDNSSSNNKSNEPSKLARIVQGLEAVYREMETVRKELPQNEDGEMMRKMCLPIMGQLDCAFKLHRETASGPNTTGGFVDVS